MGWWCSKSENCESGPESIPLSSARVAFQWQTQNVSNWRVCSSCRGLAWAGERWISSSNLLGFRGCHITPALPRRRLASQAVLLEHLLATPLPHTGLATKCLLCCQQQRRFHSGVHGRAAGCECRPPLQPDPFHPSFSRTPQGGRSPPQAPVGERGGKMQDVNPGNCSFHSMQEWSGTHVCQASFWHTEPFWGLSSWEVVFLRDLTKWALKRNAGSIVWHSHPCCSPSSLYLPWVIWRCSSPIPVGPCENTAGFCFILCHPL